MCCHHHCGCGYGRPHGGHLSRHHEIYPRHFVSKRTKVQRLKEYREELKEELAEIEEAIQELEK